MSTSEEAIQPDVLHRWNLSAIREYLKRIWMAVQGDPTRGFDPDAVINVPSGIVIDRDLLQELIQNRSQRREPSNGHGSVNNGWSTWVLGIVGALIVASVLGLISTAFTMNGRMAALETKVDMLLMMRK